MKYAFAILMGIHGLIHLMGLVSAFLSTSIEKQVLGISKPIGALWLITFILFTVSAFQFLSNKHWFYLGITSAIVSQTLIIIAWNDTKLGTILNLIILLVGIHAYGKYRFQKMVELESRELFSNITQNNIKVIKEEDLNHLPNVIQKWLKHSGIIGKEEIVTVRLKQKGKMRTKPSSKWMPFVATQYFNTKSSSFVWSTTVDALLIKMIGRDKLTDGNGEMLIKLGAIIPVVNESQNDKINSGAMIRYLAEICWFPSSALNKYMTWQSIDETSAKATFIYKNQSVSGVFSFSTKGDFISFTADRYYGGSTNSTLETWHVEALSHKEFNGVKIPNKCKVTWKLSGGDFNWLKLEITDIEFN
ncbi:DUF6544 family protein [uncultured Winogradskyella sp.]|uniref:DUF6544 family protein n=1 Tax=uncultured Winogradskyella sp. TaxID=395353 RepID=UPI00261EB3B4|nr:DUF6544 family protein [uncultured Winogradskyella sp.]